MKRFLLILIAVAAVVAFLTPPPAHAADFSFGGMFWTKFYATENIKDGTDDLNDTGNGFYTRARMYFTAKASENLMAVVKVEVDDIWGDGRIGTTSIDGGSDGRGDENTPGNSNASANSGFEIKNFYVQFNIPNTPLTAMAGALPAKIGSGIVFNDDTNGLVLIGKFDPVKAKLVYSRVNDNAPLTSTGIQSVGAATYIDSGDNWDLWAADVSYAPTKELGLTLGGALLTAGSPDPGFNQDLNLYLLSLDLDYKTDMFSIYFTGIKDLGSVDQVTAGGNTTSADFTGWAIMTGGTVNVKPVVLGLDFYYATGQKLSQTDPNDDIKEFQTPGVDGRPTYFMDEIVFPGMFDDESSTVNTFPNNNSGMINNVRSTGMTRTNQGYDLTNIWAIGLHADFKPLDQTLIQVGGAYMGFVEDVYSDITKSDGDPDDTLGTSLYIRLTQGVVDGLQLKAAFGYLFADDGYSIAPNEDDAWKFATGLFWSW